MTKTTLAQTATHRLYQHPALLKIGASALLIAVAGLAASHAQAQTQAQPQAQTQPQGQPAMRQGPQHTMHHGMGPGMAMGASMISDRMLDAAGVSADQKAKLRAIFKSAGDDLRGQRDAGRDMQSQMLALMTAPTVDAAAAEALRQKQMAGQESASKRMLQAMLDAQAVLTPEQRGKLAERIDERRQHMDQRRERMQQHHDRRPADAPKS